MARERFRLWRWRIGRGVIVVLALAAAAVITMDRWIFIVLNPGPFDPKATPPPPDYSIPSSWAALPETADGADVSLPELPAIDQSTAPADVFYLHPTTWLGASWNAPIDDPAIIEATTNGGTLIQASAFNACCAVYAPRYRQANGRAFTNPDANSERAVAIAYADVAAAFDAFLKRNNNRPFVLASHSQGTVLAARLLRERIHGHDIEKRLIVAYLIGGPIRPDTIGADMPICKEPAETGCVVAFNARARGYKPNDLEFNSADPDTIAGRICVNPLSFKHDERPAPASANLGALFFDNEEPQILPAFAAAQCEGGALTITDIGPIKRDLKSSILLRMMPGNYHPIEYQLFYVNLRRNALERVNAFLKH